MRYDVASSDLHLGHRRIAEYTGRPYHHVHEMDANIVARWNSRVAPGTRVLLVGDLVLGQLDENLHLLSLLNGELDLVPGNHDRCWRGDRRHLSWEQRYLDAGVARILHDPEPIEIAGQLVDISHFPYRGDSHDNDRYLEWRPDDRGRWLICGHVHTAWRQRGRQINVGIDAWGGWPVTFEQIAEIIAEGEADRDVIAWELWQ